MKRPILLLILLLILSVLLSCSSGTPSTSPTPDHTPSSGVENPSGTDLGKQPMKTVTVTLTDIPVYDGTLSIVVNDNVPFFKISDLTTVSYEFYSNLDSLGRVGYAMASLSTDTMPPDGEDRGSIASVTPTGWLQATYDCVPGKYVYNRAHLIGWQLSAENANKKNLMTGTQYFNTANPKESDPDWSKKNGMLNYENMIADYIKETGNHVVVRVTPVFSGNSLVAHGVLYEAKSVEDNGEGIEFNVFIYNVQPDITIDYATGKTQQTPGYTNKGESGMIPDVRLVFQMSVPAEDGDVIEEESPTDKPSNTEPPKENPPTDKEKVEYALNTSSKKVHLADCASAKTIALKNKEVRLMTLSEFLELLKSGYSACKTCLREYAD